MLAWQKSSLCPFLKSCFSESPPWAPLGTLSGTCSSSPVPGQAVGQVQAMIHQDHKTSLFTWSQESVSPAGGIKSQNTLSTTLDPTGMKATSMSKEHLFNGQFIIIFSSEFINNPEEPVRLPWTLKIKMSAWNAYLWWLRSENVSHSVLSDSLWPHGL